jgi:hypothetical protein
MHPNPNAHETIREQIERDLSEIRRILEETDVGGLVLLAVAIAVVSSSTLGCSRRNRRTSWSASSTTVRLVDPVVLSTAIVPLR